MISDDKIAQPLLFVSTGLETGGAERMLVKILTNIDRSKFEPCVVSLFDRGSMGSAIEQLGVRVVCLNINTVRGALTAPFRLARLIRQQQFKVIQGWMYHGNLFAWLGRLLAGSSAALSFGVRNTLYELNREKPNTRWAIRLNAWLSRYAAACMFNSRLSLDRHQSFGFCASRMRVIPNGFELDAFQPNQRAGDILRETLALGVAPVIGLVARFDPAKDHKNFLQAAVIVRKNLSEVRFVLVGRGITAQNRELMAWIEELGLSDAVMLLGERSDIPDLNNLFDVACLASWMEAFPNVVGEAMACGTPCVVTDVGDCRDIVGDTGRVASPRDPDGLAIALLSLLKLSHDERAQMGILARQRIMSNFDIENITKDYMCYFEMLSCLTARGKVNS